jgi:hypothetical protein
MSKRTSKRKTGPPPGKYRYAHIPRRYSTPEGVRLNVAAIAEKYRGRITARAFRLRQWVGWTSLNGGKLNSVKKQVTLQNCHKLRGEDTFLEREVDEAMGPPGPRGRWLTKGLIWQGEDGRLSFTANYLEQDERYGAVRRSSWFKWATEYPCPQLDTKENDGFIHSLLIEADVHSPIRVFLQDDANEIVGRLTDPAARGTDPGGYGRWLTDDIFELRHPVPEKCLAARELLCRDEYLSEKMGVTTVTIGGWRERGHAAIPKSVFEGRLRFLRITRPPGLRRGPGTVVVSSLSDADKIHEWRQEQRQLANGAERGGGCTNFELAGHFGLNLRSTQDARELNLVLVAFRKDVPDATWENARWDDVKNRPLKKRLYDKTKLIRWLNGRTVRAVAIELKHIETPRTKRLRAKHLQYATNFLIFVLTRGRWSPRAFGNFVRNLPVGKQLKPCDGVSAGDVMRWARMADVGMQNLLDAAKKLPIVRTKAGLPRGRCVWRLPEPVVVPAPPIPDPDSNGQGPTASAAKVQGHSPTPHRFRRTNKRTLDMYRYCYEEYRVKARTRPNVWRDAKAKFGEKGLSAESTVTRNANRYEATEEFWRRSQRGGDLENANRHAEKLGGTKTD